MKLRNGAFWKVTGNSDLTRLDFGDNAVIDMEQAAGYQKLQTGTLNGDRGTFVLGADISTAAAVMQKARIIYWSAKSAEGRVTTCICCW